MPISEKEHDGARVVELIHRVEIWDLGYVNQIYDGEITDFFGAFV